MLTNEIDVASFLDSPVLGGGIPCSINDGGTATDSGVPYVEPGYEGKIDYRIRQLSYSSLLTLHNCPRKFELYRKRSTFKAEESDKSSITFAFGHVVGEGIQLIFEGKSYEEVVWNTFIKWKPDIFKEDEKAKKSIWDALRALDMFFVMRSSGFLSDYELVYYKGKPACELSFSIILPDGFRLRGFVDAVLKHKVTGKVIVLECKTTGFNVLHPAMYKNSSQAIGYSIVLDAIFPDISDYDVLYLVYQTSLRSYETLTFSKSYLQRALWIRELLLDIEVIKMYEEANIYPQRGESCMSFGRECEYFQTCGLSTDYLTKPCTEAEADKTDYQISITFEQLIDAQLEKS